MLTATFTKLRSASIAIIFILLFCIYLYAAYLPVPYEYTSGAKTIRRQGRDQLIIGILSRTGNACRRKAFRETFIAKAKTYKALDVRVFFVLDKVTPKLLLEQKVYGDLVFLNVSMNGWNIYFGLKYYMWIKHAVENFPNATMIGRIDDDVFACTPQIFDRLYNVQNPMLYYGYPTGTVSSCPTRDCVDEMFIVIGIELANRVINVPLCNSGAEGGKHKTKRSDCLLTTKSGTGTHEFRRWIKRYKDAVLVNERRNNLMIWFYSGSSRNDKRLYNTLRTWDFCRKYLLFHSATIDDIYRMDIQNNLQAEHGFANDNTAREIRVTVNCTNIYL